MRGFGFAKFGTIIAGIKTGIRADPDSSRHDLGVAIASVALPKRECGRSLKPRKKRGVWECVQWSRDEAGKVGGREGVPAKLGSVLTADPQTPCGEDGGEPVQIGGVLRTDAKTSCGKRVGVSAKLWSSRLWPHRVARVEVARAPILSAGGLVGIFCFIQV